MQLRSLARTPVGYAKRWRDKGRGGYRHELAMCAIFREEAPFLDEWLEFHAAVGATHFYLYNNFSTDDFRRVLQPWIARGVVTLTDWPVAVGQLSAYRHCLKRAGRECRWLALIDIDEFLFSPQTLDIRDILERYADLPGVDVWQRFFGSGGHVARPDLPVTEAYLKCAELNAGTTVKTVANPRMVYKVGIHRSKYWLGDSVDTTRRYSTSCASTITGRARSRTSRPRSGARTHRLRSRATRCGTSTSRRSSTPTPTRRSCPSPAPSARRAGPTRRWRSHAENRAFASAASRFASRDDAAQRAGGYRSTAKMRHSPGTPLSDRLPRSAKRRPDPATRSFTVLETSTSPAAASAAMRAPM